MITKWDIVENVPSVRAVDSNEHIKRGKIKGPLRAAVATTLFAGTLLLPQYAVSNPVNIAQVDFGVANNQHTGFMDIQSDFVRPRSDRGAAKKALTDTTIGMSTRRLAEAHSKLFYHDETEDTELTGEYSFL